MAAIRAILNRLKWDTSRFGTLGMIQMDALEGNLNENCGQFHFLLTSWPVGSALYDIWHATNCI